MTGAENGGRTSKPEWVVKFLEPWILERERLKSVARRRGMLIEYGSEPTVEISHHTPVPPEFSRLAGQLIPDRPFVCELPDVRLQGPYPIGVDAYNNIILETCQNSRHMLLCKLDALLAGEPLADTLSRFVPWAPTRHSTVEHSDVHRLFLLISYWNNYFHWMLMQLPRLRSLEQYKQATGRDPMVAVSPDGPSWLTESLDLVGLDRDQRYEWDTDQAKVDHLVIPMSRYKWADDYYPSRADCEWLKERVLSNIPSGAVDKSPSERIFVSRADADDRRVENRRELLDRLHPLGFTEYVLSDLSVEEQVALFANSELIVGPHGAGLVNMLFSRDAMVIELLPDSVVRPVFYYLSKEVGLEYEFLVTESTGCDDLTVDPDRVVSVVEQYV
jgi:hypothetical protein